MNRENTNLLFSTLIRQMEEWSIENLSIYSSSYQKNKVDLIDRCSYCNTRIVDHNKSNCSQCGAPL